MNDVVKPIRIKIDSREKNTQVIKHWKEFSGNFPGLEYEFVEMEFGDYAIGNSIIIERKSSTDFMLSVMDKHVLNNVASLKKTYEHVIYIVEGDIYTPRFHSDPIALRKAIAYMTIKEHVSFTPSPGPQNTAELIYLMAQLSS
ncbi:ERCC4 domain-containing protein [Sulfurirhabdus autotrophica]|uniref:ERCC4 domain-containing protein n=1 Tax=Sulfurirhabdus autotrophica TaxID=1706046 RepID=A0A4R3Y146_9PROT|nr:ERCC4 domain-containing protein [Sulfurirhabdus autotrophica]TCV85370.1 ERCC4 domain-containing protein [Sulfurirhabdus autotrophica]